MPLSAFAEPHVLLRISLQVDGFAASHETVRRGGALREVVARSPRVSRLVRSVGGIIGVHCLMHPVSS